MKREEFEDKKKEASFNMAVKFLDRLHDLLSAANFHSENLQLYSWYRTLMCIYREISPKLTNAQKQEYAILWPKITSTIRRYCNRRNSGHKGYPRETEFIMHEFDVLLRKHMDHYDLLMPNKKAINELMDS